MTVLGAVELVSEMVSWPLCDGHSQVYKVSTQHIMALSIVSGFAVALLLARVQFGYSLADRTQSFVAITMEQRAIFIALRRDMVVLRCHTFLLDLLDIECKY